MKKEERPIIAQYGNIKLVHEPPEIVSTFNFLVTFNLDNMRDIKQKRDITEELKYIDINNTYLEFYQKPKTYEQILGTTSIEFLNNIDKIRELYKEYKDKILELNEDNTQISIPIYILQELCSKIENSLNLKYCYKLMQNEIYTFLKSGIHARERFLSTTEEYKDKVNTLKFYQEQCSAFINRFLRKLDNLEKLAESSFIKKKTDLTESDYNLSSRFNMKNLNIPIAKLEFDTESETTIFKYIYKVKDIEDLINITIYHLMLNNNVLLKCKCCKKFFIPIRNNRTYCTDTIWGTKKNGENITCEDKIKENYHISRESEYIKDYNKIYKKINKAINTKKINLKQNAKRKKELIEKFEKFKKDYKEICNQYKYDKKNIEFLKKLDSLFEQINKDYNNLKI